MAAPDKLPPKRRAATPAKGPKPKSSAAAAPSGAVAAKPALQSKKPATKKPKRIRGEFAIPAADFERIAKLKEVARRAGLSVKKNELLRMGLQALQAISSGELHDRIRTLRLTEAPPKR